MKPLSIKDIAKKANVSITTVSFILNGKAEKMRISQDMIAKVEAIIKEVGFKPNQVARSLRTGNTNTIGLIVEDISNPFFAAIARLIEDKAYKHGYKIIYSSTENNLEKAKGLIKMFKSRQVDGYIIAPMVGMEEDIRELLSDRTPVVVFDRHLPGLEVSSVLVDNIKGTYMATDSLIHKGMKNIAFVTVDVDVEQIKDRYKGYEQALKANKIKINKKLCKLISFSNTADETTAELTKFFTENPEIDAVLFATNYLAVRGLFSFREMNKQLNAEFKVIAYDDHDIFKLHSPTISAVDQPIEEIAENVINFVLKELAVAGSFEKKELNNVVLSSRLIER
ncbi:LacI family transcriptional regulator [Pedobacter cryoconitis]|uniref:LacI family DNA-binding transcriptional regulator n=1 Tax=Pedobacter cryoconitis TaxID=188932 RepID=UPI0016181579|nr:LacI family DNA-binding transcriptional regulator [Pedobacter cryoconitis]MBB6271929.1 LacI family transcriptional regulator [Pedobacter cryoconitis]